jgi:hypothetical protein
MIRICTLSLLALCLLAIPAAAFADDAGMAAGLVGTWKGQWEFGDVKGNLTLKITAAKDAAVDGEMTWFGTAAGDVTEHFKVGKVKGRQLKVSGDAMSFVATVSEDGKSMDGKWTNDFGVSGPLKVKKAE